MSTKAWVNDTRGSAYRVADDNKVFSTKSGEQVGNFVDGRMIAFDGEDLGGLQNGPSIPIENLDASSDD